MSKCNDKIKITLDIYFDDNQISPEEIDLLVNFFSLLLEKVIHNVEAIEE